VAGSASVFVTTCIFSENTATAGASGSDSSGNNNGYNGGAAQGGGLYISGAVTNADIENSVFFANTCTGGAGGSATVGDVEGGNGGSALGGGLASAAVLTIVQNCTMATNTLAAGAVGSGTVSGAANGSTQGWDIGRSAGSLKLIGSVLSGGTNSTANHMPNAYGVTDGDYNISSDASLSRAAGDSTLINSTNTDLDSGLANYGGPYIGPDNLLDPPSFLTLAIVDGSVATNFIPGVPGLSFPATDELGNPRGSPACVGAFELTPITIDSNAPAPDVTLTDTSSNIETATGATATMTVNAVNFDTNNTLGYQWQLNGTNLPENSTFIGTTSNSLTVKGVTVADDGAYQVVVSVSLLESATTSSVVSLVIVNPAEIKTQPVSQRDAPNGSVVTFSVTATGSPPPTYQWYQVTPGLVTNKLTDINEISGSTNSELTIDPATTNDDGSYFVVVSNPYRTNTSVEAVLNIVPDLTSPKVAFSSPSSGARTTNSVVTGTASDTAQVVLVNYWVTNFNAGHVSISTVLNGMATLGTNGTTTKSWSITNGLNPGTNFVTVQSVDYSGNKSAFATREFFYEVPAEFRLYTSGLGTVSGNASVAGGVRPTNLAMLNIGEGYTLTAVPGKNYVLSNWVSSTGITSNSSTLLFIMEGRLAIAANFTTNLFMGAAGTYNGLFAGDEVTEQTAGMLQNLTVRSTGTYSGNLLLGGVSYILAGSFNSYGIVNTNVKRTAAEGGPVNVDMTLNWTNGEITGSVSGGNLGGWDSPLQAELSAASSPSAEYTVVLSPGTNATGEIPPGFGYMLITNHNGSVTLSGALADGTAFTQTPPLGLYGDVPVYANLYGKAGLLLGWLGLSNGTVEAEYPLTWIKPAASSGLYSTGLTNLLLVTGSCWTNPPTKISAVSLADGTLTISNTSLVLDFAVAITNDTVIKASNDATNSLTGTIAPKTGLLQITFGNGAGKATTVGVGAMLQNSTEGGGYFVTKTNAGAILLRPNQ
jgi:hypothetical protein